MSEWTPKAALTNSMRSLPGVKLAGGTRARKQLAIGRRLEARSQTSVHLLPTIVLRIEASPEAFADTEDKSSYRCRVSATVPGVLVQDGANALVAVSVDL